jgi:hypothetical protein
MTINLNVALDIDPVTGPIFYGDPRYVNQSGDMIFFNLKNTDVNITIYIINSNYQFDVNNPISIAENLNSKGQPNGPGNPVSPHFVLPALPLANAAQLPFYDDNRGHRHFYYALNLLDLTNPGAPQPYPIDPIIFNN